MLAMSCALTVECRLVVSRNRRRNSSVRYAERLRLGGDDALDALALDDAGQDAVHAHLVRPGLDREAFGEADDAPLRRGVRACACAKAVAAGDGREVDDAAAAGGLDERHRLARAVEHAVQIDGDAAVPVLGADVLDLGGRAGDAGVVDEHVEAAELVVSPHRKAARHLRDMPRRRGARKSLPAATRAPHRRHRRRAPARRASTKVCAIARPIPAAPAVTRTRLPIGGQFHRVR